MAERPAASFAGGAAGRALRWSACLNVRDVGGLPLLLGGEVRRGALVRADSLARLTDAGWQALLEHGVRTIVELSAPNEPAYVAPDAVQRVSTPIFEIDGGLDALYAACREAADYYRVWVEHRAEAFGAAVRAVADAGEGAVLVHCQAGRDRTGVVVALLLGYAGVPDEVVGSDYTASGPPWRAVFDDLIARADDVAERARLVRERECPPSTILSVLAWVRERHGSVEGYLRSAGVDRARLGRLRERLAG